MKKVTVLAMGIMLLLGMIAFAEETPPPVQATASEQAVENKAEQTENSVQVVISYLHMNRRCMTCEKLEAYSQEVIATEFVEQLKDSSLVWRVANFEEKENEHFAKDYQLYSQSLILSRLIDGQETEWKNLDKIWELVGDKEDFSSYVQAEVQKFMNPAVEK